MIEVLIAKHKINHTFIGLNHRDFEAFLSDWKDNYTFICPVNLPVQGER